jgi:phosphatidylserine/phosphatidylglycerophosphate/cardiolipin synthase-like enzyme
LKKSGIKETRKFFLENILKNKMFMDDKDFTAIEKTFKEIDEKYEKQDEESKKEVIGEFLREEPL